jgi:outer membrane receptor for ferrienterochelin and colicin
MRKSYCFLAAWLFACLFSLSAYAQSVTVSGSIKNSASKESVPAVSVVVKGTNQGTFTNSDGGFSLKVTKLPVVLVVSSVGYDSQEITVTDASKPVEVNLVVNNNTIVDEVVVAATRTPQRILEAPVTVERLSNATIRNLPAPAAYEGIGNLKGVDVHTASLTFRTMTTRGFVSSGNTRLNQLVDGMDNQAPGLNFAVSSIVGLTDLDIDNIEVLSGASSALYGSGGMNGTILITSKSPFKYNGFSFQVKQGMMHVDKKQRAAAPYNNVNMRWAKVFKNKLAFRLSGELIRGSDWEAEDYRNKKQIGILSRVVGGNRYNDPNFNGVNVYGDETDINMDAFSLAVMSATSSAITGNSSILTTIANNYFTSQGNPVYPTNAQYAGYIGTVISTLGIPPAQQAAVSAALQQQFLPFYNGYRNGYYRNQNISRTGYNEDQLVDYNTLNVKMNAGIHYKFTDNLEGSINSYFGTGTTVYTGANRYSLRGFKMAQHKLEFKSKNWMFRAYTIQENAGDSYIGDAVGSFLNEAYSPSATVWLPTYVATFSETRRNMGLGILPNQADITIHNSVRAQVDANRLIPGTQAYKDAVAKIRSTPVNRPGGAKFLDKSDLYSMEGQFNISDAVGFSNVVEVMAGMNWKQWVLNSQGTIFADTMNAIRINEYGGFIQLKKALLDNKLTLTASGRYDKQTNFDGKFTPRVTAVVRVARDNHVRLSYQTAYRFPSNQNQYISLRLGGGSSFLIGSLPSFQTYYKLNGVRPGYTAASILAYRAGTPADSSRLVLANFKELKPETVASYEVGYKGIVGKKLLVDAYYYMSRYKDFIVSVAVGQAQVDNAGKLPLYSSFSTNNVSYNQNSATTVKSKGWGIGLEYKAVQNYVVYGNVFSDELSDVAPGEVTYFNAPKYRYNIGLRNDDVCKGKGLGFNVIFKWQDNNYYEGTFISGTLPYFGWWDAQVSYRPRGTKSVFRAGGTNLGNFYARTGYGSPSVGGLYYVSYGYNIF